ncbi:MAG: hypothetical protein ACK4OF_03800 [Aquificaceae bacterium]
MLKSIALISLVVRILVFAFFIALSMDQPSSKQAFVILPSVLYLMLSIYNFLYPGKLKIFKDYVDLLFVPILAFISGKGEAILALLPFIALQSSRRTFEGILFLWLSLGFSFYYYGKAGFVLLPLLISHYIASLHPDLIETLRKERFYIKKLRKAYSKLSQEYGEIEKGILDLRTDALLLHKLQTSHNLEEYLLSMKDIFNLKAIRLVPSKAYSERASVDMSTCSFHLPVRLEKGYVEVVFYLNNPLELYDERLLKNLEKAGKLINLYVEGFEEKAKSKEIAL